MKTYVAVDDFTKESFVGNLKEILHWQEDLEIPFMRCDYYELGDEIDYETVIREYEK